MRIIIRSIVCVLTLSGILLSLTPYLEAQKTCRKCKQLKRKGFIGIKSLKQYLIKDQEVTVFKNIKLAQAAGYTRFSDCSSSQASKAKKTKKCKPAIGITADSMYLCPYELKPFKSLARARKKNYSGYDACGTRSPVDPDSSVEPIPGSPDVTSELGTRIDNVLGACIFQLPDTSFVAYTSESASLNNPAGLKYLTSQDGLVWSVPQLVSGPSRTNFQTFMNPAGFVSNNGTVNLIYERLSHVSSAAIDIHTIFQATSVDGKKFSDPEFAMISDGSSISSYFNPSVTKVGTTSYRLYYTKLSNNYSVISTDEGTNWASPEDVKVLGSSSTYASYPSQISVVLLDDGKYLMFLSAAENQNSSLFHIYTAESQDGLNFQIHDQALLTSSADAKYSSPKPVRIAANTIRLYLIKTTTGNNASNLLESVLVDTSSQ